MTDKPATKTNTLLADIDRAIEICDDLEHEERYRSSVNPQKYAEVIEALAAAQSAILALVGEVERLREYEKLELIRRGEITFIDKENPNAEE